MTSGTQTREAEQLFEHLVSRFLADPMVSQGTGFGSTPGLRVGGKIFAMLVRGELVMKLSKERVDQLVASRYWRTVRSEARRATHEGVGGHSNAIRPRLGTARR